MNLINKILDYIKQQPERDREIMFFVSSFITILLVGIIWFNSFQKNLYALLNPEEDFKKSFAATESVQIPSLFGFMAQSFLNIKDSISIFFNNEEENNQNIENNNGANLLKRKDQNQVYVLPLPDYK
jgi:hypothetical protein